MTDRPGADAQEAPPGIAKLLREHLVEDMQVRLAAACTPPAEVDALVDAAVSDLPGEDMELMRLADELGIRLPQAELAR